VYDDADRLLSLTHKKADDTVIEALSYSYDAKGQRITEGGSSTGANETPFTAAYDEANRLTTLTLTGALAYDDNGNLASKTDQTNPPDVTTYLWDSRDRLIGINAPGITASFTYDALGRRTSKTVNGQLIGYVYNGKQAIGEVTGGTISATVLTTLAIDDVVARCTQTGNRTYLTNALGSVIRYRRTINHLKPITSTRPTASPSRSARTKGIPSNLQVGRTTTRACTTTEHATTIRR
jgi:YD repeat-containing protein